MNGGFAPTKILRTGDVIADWVPPGPKLDVCKSIWAMSIVSCWFGPEITTPVGIAPTCTSLPHSSCASISASCAALYKAVHKRSCSISFVDPMCTTLGLYCFNCPTSESKLVTERPESKYCVLAKSKSISSARLATAPTFSRAFPAFSTASPDLVSASFEWLNAVSDLVSAVDALVSALRALASRDPIVHSDRVSFLCPYGYAAISDNAAIAKQHRPIFSSSFSFFSSFDERWANTSKTTSSAKNTSAAPSRPLWARLTESSEFQSGKPIAKCVIVACILIAALVSPLFFYRRKWEKGTKRGNPTTAPLGRWKPSSA